MAKYRARVLDAELRELGSLPALAIEGAKGVGKTATAQRRAETVVRLDEDAQREIASADPKRVLQGTPPVLLDEWQRVPELWDVVRRAVDDEDPPGPFLLTGSASPPDGKDDPPRHSGAGRIAALRMRPMCLTERRDLAPTVSLSALIRSQRTSIHGDTDFTLDDYTDEIARSGFPGIRSLQPRALRLQLDAYIGRIIDRDIEDELGRKVRRPERLRRWMAAYAAATATTASLEKIRRAASPGESVPAQATAQKYREALERLFILDPVTAWLPSSSHLRRLAQGSKHHLVDPALAVSLLGLSKHRLLDGEGGLEAIPLDRPFLGSLFESLVTLSIKVFAQAAEARVYHLRTANGDHEVDLIVESPSGKVVAIEVKLSNSVDEKDGRHLRWLESVIGDRLSESVIVNTGPHAYRRSDGIAVVPLALLGA